MLEQLIENVRQQTEAYTKILDCAKRQQQAIIAADTQTLDAINSEEKDLADSARALEQTRLEITEELRVKLGIKGNADVRALCGAVRRDQAIGLARAAGALSGVIKQITAVNQLNNELLQVHFQYVDYVLGAAADIAQPSNIYSSAGREAQPVQLAGSGLFSTEV